ncbi:MAG: peptidase S8, partial [Proteobacteria bacterium]
DGLGNEIGMAPDAQWMACRNMDAGNGKPSTYIECFEFFIAPYPQGEDPMTAGNPLKAPHVINNSWGCTADEGCVGQEITPVLEALYRAGVMVVVSAGNDGPGCSTIHEQPATLSPYTLSVGAHNHRDGKIASFSSRGPSTLDGQVGPDLTAPGVSIRSAVPGGGYASGMWSGTSMAGPHVAGAVALLWSAKPELIGNIDETAKIIRETATPTTSTQVCGNVAGTAVPNNTFGFGRLNVAAAVAKALEK